MIGPKLLEANGVRVQKVAFRKYTWLFDNKFGISLFSNSQVVHEAGSMIIVFPHAYHSGFNHGFVI